MPEQQENQTEVFHLKAPFKPTGDQPQAIEALVQGLKAGDKIRYFKPDFPQFLRQHRIILSADTASEVRQLLSQKRR